MKHSISILIIGAALLTASCNRLDVTGMFFSSGTHTEDRVAEWLAWDDEHGQTLISDVPDEYSFYVCSDIHLNNETSRVEKFLDAEFRDGDAIFSVINGDIGNESGERPYRLLDSITRAFRPYGSTSAQDTCFVVIGNHDIYFDCQQYFTQYFHTSTYTATVQTVSGAKDLFIFLDSGNGTIGKRQMAWLKELLTHRSEYRHVVVSTHTCLFRTSYNYSTTPAANLPEDEYYELTSLMDKNDVSLFLMGHFHHQEAHLIGNVPYVMTDNLNDESATPTYLKVTLGKDVDYQYCELREL